MPQFEKGKSGNPAGRPKGSYNKLTKHIRTSLADALAGHIEAIPAELDKLPAKERLELLLRFMPYIMGKVKDAEPMAAGEEERFADW